MAESDVNRESEAWKTPMLRQNVRLKIEEAIKVSGNPTSKSVQEMEAHIYNKARTKEEYLSLVARLILHVKEMNPKKQQPGMQQMPGIPSQSSDPMSALQNMAGPQQMNDMSNGNAMHLSVSNPNDNVMVNNSSPVMSSGIQNMINQNQMTHISNVNPNASQMNPNRVTAPIGMTGNRMLNQVMMGSNGNMTTARPQQVLSNNLQVHLQRLRQPAANMQNVNSIPVSQNPVQESKYFDNQQMQQMSNAGAVNPSQQQFKTSGIGSQQFQQNTNAMIPQNQNQVMNNMQSMNQMANTPQMMPSPSGYAPSPSPMMASPHSTLIRQTGSHGAPSPQNISLNTPANIMIASPGSVGPVGRPANEEQIYLEKLRSLQKYVDPLKKMIARIDQDDRYSIEKKKEFDKIRNLFNILTDSSRRVPMATIEKCEQFLEKMDFKIKTENVVPTVVSTTTQSSVPKIQDVCQPLLDAITAHMKKPLFNHTLQRTFGPAVAALTNNAYKNTSPPLLKRKYEEESEVPEVLQGEIARLDARFKVQLDPLQHNGSKTIHLICKLDDKDLPCVPPIAIRVPESYPEKPPQCSTDPLEYSASLFFQDIQRMFDSNINKLPEYFSVTSLLNSWELSVRQAVSSALEHIYT